MASPNTNAEMESSFQAIKSPSLENQIEIMLDKIMDGDNEEENIGFSDDENSFEKLDREKVNHQIDGANSLLNSALFLNCSTTSEEQDRTGEIFSFKRMTKKFPTISFNNNPSPSFQNPNCYMKFPPGMNFSIPSMVIPVCQKPIMVPQNMYPTFNNQFKRSDRRKKTYDISKEQLNFRSQLCFNTNNNNNLSINSGTSFNSLNSTSCFSNRKQPQGFSPKEKGAKFLMNGGYQNKEKRFSTMMFPKGTNMQIEMLLYELNNALTKTEKIDYFIYNKLQGNFVNIIKTHKGSRIFQNYLKNTHCDIIHQIFSEISGVLSEIISDSYANYFCKRFFTYLNQKDRVDFLIAIQNSLVSLSVDSIGTYPIQGIIEQVGSKIEKKIITTALQNAISELCFNTYGTHVLEKIICCFEEEFTTFIYDYVANNFLILANNINGICIVKKVLTLTHKKELHEKLKKLSYDNALGLIQHSYGNYVIQVIVENWEEKEVMEVVSQFEGKFVCLSMQKYSSNVVERCIEKNDKILSKFINEIYSSERIAEVMKNNFGNYVIQKALKLSTGKERTILAEIVNKNIFKLNDKKLIAKWKSIVFPYMDNNEYLQQSNH